MTTARHLLPAVILVVLAALTSGVVGFVYAHEPARDQIALAVDRERPAGSAILVSGAVAEVRDGHLRVAGEGGSIDLGLPTDVPVEDLQPMAPENLANGMRIDVGVERSDYGVALSGLVVVTGQ